MQEEGIEAYNSDSGDGEFPMDDPSDEDPVNPANDDAEGTNGWIGWFCALDGHEYMIEVDEAYIRDPFNLFGLQN